MKYSASEENYIKCIFHLQQETGLVNTGAMAQEMRTSPASVTDMLKKLKAKKLLQYERYRGFKLNDAGRKVALGIIRKHRLWEYFLSSKLGFEWDKVHAIAEELEHVSSSELIRRLDHFLGNPSFDPHGDPIPDVNGRIPQVRQQNLHSLPLMKQALVSSVANQSAEMLDLLRHYGIHLGTTVKVIRRFDFDGSMEIRIARNKPCMISEQIAKNVFVHYDQ